MTFLLIFVKKVRRGRNENKNAGVLFEEVRSRVLIRWYALIWLKASSHSSIADNTNILYLFLHNDTQFHVKIYTSNKTSRKLMNSDKCFKSPYKTFYEKWEFETRCSLTHEGRKFVQHMPIFWYIHIPYDS